MPTPDKEVIDPELDLDPDDKEDEDEEDELDDFGEPIKATETKDDSFGRLRR